jgi:hypothetical protein
MGEMAFPQRRNAMTHLGKTLFISLSLAALVGGTLLLRSNSEPAPAPVGQLSPAQMAELKPAPKPAEPPKAVPAQDAGNSILPPEPDLEDGSGS